MLHNDNRIQCVIHIKCVVYVSSDLLEMSHVFGNKTGHRSDRLLQ